MANELTVTGALELNKDSIEVSLSESIKVTVSGSKITEIIQNIGTSAESVDIGDIGTVGYVIAKNLDTTNFVELRDGAAGADVVKMKAGEIAVFRSVAADLNAIADTAACNVRFLIIED